MWTNIMAMDKKQKLFLVILLLVGFGKLVEVTLFKGDIKRKIFDFIEKYLEDPKKQQKKRKARVAIEEEEDDESEEQEETKTQG